MVTVAIYNILNQLDGRLYNTIPHPWAGLYLDHYSFMHAGICEYMKYSYTSTQTTPIKVCYCS